MVKGISKVKVIAFYSKSLSGLDVEIWAKDSKFDLFALKFYAYHLHIINLSSEDGHYGSTPSCKISWDLVK